MADTIRTIALAVCHDGRGRILVERGYDRVRGEPFLRAIGGGVEFGERAVDALAREFREELGLSLESPRLLGVIESLFTYEGRAGHEVVFVFAARVAEGWAYEREEITSTEPDGLRHEALWVPLEELRRGPVRFAPAGLLDLVPSIPHPRTESEALGRTRSTGDGVVEAVSRSDAHTFSKSNEDAVRLLAGLGVEGDAHLGVTVKHRSRVARDPSQPNLRQVHLIHAELHDELRAAGFTVSPGEMGENVTTRGIDLLALPVGARLHLGGDAVVEVTGLRNPCAQLDRFQPGLMAAVLDRDEHGELVRKAGVMGIVLAGGDVRPGDAVRVELPPGPHRPLEPV